ncbi:MAG: GGDEF domain-containing protein [Rhodospirillaceae bacterium]
MKPDQAFFTFMFERLFNIVPFGVYVVDVETYEVIYANEVLIQDRPVEGVKCWELIYGNSRPCLFCKIKDLLNEDGSPNKEVAVFENFDESRDTWHQLQELAFSWLDGRTVKYSIAVDITRVKMMQNRLAEAHAELQLTHRELEKTAMTDPLTGLTNRVKLDEMFAQEAARSERYGGPLSVILMDIDHFKQVNDTHGHQVGDNVLKQTATILRKLARDADIVGRWGGEEFLILCPETDLGGASMLAERMRKAIAEHAFPALGAMTSSFGVATHRKGDSDASILKRADVALYRAKAEGRNRVEREEAPE